MKKIIVSKQAVREYIREIMSPPGMGMGWQSTGDLSTAPANVSAVVDPSAAQTDPSNPNFKPHSRKELQSAISCMVDDISDDDAVDFYDALQDVKKQRDKEDKKMKKDDKKVEEAVRKAIRNILKEAKPKKTPEFTVTNPRGVMPTVVPAGQHGGEWNRQNLQKQKQLQKTLNAMKDDEDAEEMTRADAPAAGRGRKNVMQTDIGGASFKEIAKELGYASESGAKQAAEKAMAKVRFASSMDADELQILSLHAMKDYVDFLKGSGELTAADVQLMLDHPAIVSELDGFREFFDKYMKRTMKAAAGGGEEVTEAATTPTTSTTTTGSGAKCAKCAKQMGDADKKSFEKEGGMGYPKVCASCKQKED